MGRTGSSSESRKPFKKPEENVPNVDDSAHQPISVVRTQRSLYVWLSLLLFTIYGFRAVYQQQFEKLPIPLGAEKAGKRGFSEAEALKHVKALTSLGPHPVGSDALDFALEYVLKAAEKIKKTAHWEVDVEVQKFHAQSGANRLSGGLFRGKTLMYSDLYHVILRVLPKYADEAGENTILVSSHIDTVFSTEGAGDCSSCIAVMLELARGISQWAHGFKSGVIFLFNTGEEEGLNGAHSFMTQHPWSKTIRLAVDLEAIGTGGKSGIFQTGSNPWAVETFASVAKYPSAQIVSEELFTSGAIKSGTDFQVYRELAGLSGLDFAYADNTAVYHTKNDKFELLKPGSLQHLGENMLAFLLHAASSSKLPTDNLIKGGQNSDQDKAVYFDILGTYMIVYRQRFASLLHNSVIIQSLMIWTTSLVMGGFPAAVSLVLSCLSLVLMWIFSLSFSASVAFILPVISASPVPYVASPWLVVGLFVAPAFLGALAGQYVGFLILQTYLSNVYSKREQLLPAIRAELIRLEAERWLFKAGSFQWLIFLIIGNYYKIGSSYLALVWLVSPAFAYGLLEATLTPARFPKPLKLATLLIGLTVPLLVSAGTIIRLASSLIGSAVRFDRNPGSTPDWLGSVIVAVFVAIILCLTSVYLLSYLHLSDAKRSIIFATCILFGFSLAAVAFGIVPPFTDLTARTVNVVHVVDTTEKYGGERDPVSYVSLFSTTPGKLTREIEHINEGFTCGRDKPIDYVTFSVNYGCWTHEDGEDGWDMSDIPSLLVDSNVSNNGRITNILIDTKGSTRWSLGINTDEIEDFKFKGEEELVPTGDKSSVDGWHTIQFSGGKDAPTSFALTLFWKKNSTRSVKGNKVPPPLLKLRTDFNRLTPKAERVISKLPSWCSLFGKSTSPYTLAFLTALPVNI
ncbi:hypothetical protein IC582_022721 [Cucumis melo]